MSDPASRRKPVVPFVAGNLCTGCGWCVAACPDHLLVLEVDERHRKTAELAQPQPCTGCGKCIPVCNFRAIKLVKRSAAVGLARVS